MWIIAQFSLITSERIYFSPQIRLDIDVEVRCEGAFREGTTLIGRGWHFIAQNALSSVSTESTANDHSRSKYSVVILICIPAMTQVYDFGLHVIINALQRHNYIAQTTVELFIGKIEERQPRVSKNVLSQACGRHFVLYIISLIGVIIGSICNDTYGQRVALIDMPGDCPPDAQNLVVHVRSDNHYSHSKNPSIQSLPCSNRARGMTSFLLSR